MVLKSFDLLVKILCKDTGIEDIAVYDKNGFLEANWKHFLADYKNYIAAKKVHLMTDFYRTETDLEMSENWDGVPLQLWNYKIKENLEMCPSTAKVLKEIPECRSLVFSVLGPAMHIKPHVGIYKGIYRVLLCLERGEEGECWIKINNQKINFEVGKCIVFDESFIHEVYNGTDQPRIVLYLDLFRKLPPPISWLNILIYNLIRNSFFVKNILSSYLELDKQVTLEPKFQK